MSFVTFVVGSGSSSPETHLEAGGEWRTKTMLPQVDPVLVGIVVVLLVVVFGLFLFIRRTVTAFTEGLRGGER
jgi:hypothetical protein